MKKRGFTLIELLIVVAIIVILAVIVILNLASAKDRSRFARVASDMEGIATAVGTYKIVNNGAYPADVAGAGMPTEPDFANYLPNGWPKTPCGDTVSVYDYQNWEPCEIAASGNTKVGVTYKSNANGDKFYSNIIGLNACFAEGDINSASPKEITCKE